MLFTNQLKGPAKQRQAAQSAESQKPIYTLCKATPPSHRAEGALTSQPHPPLPPSCGSPPSHPPPVAHLFGSCWSCLLAHPVPSLGTITMLGSFPLFSDFRLGRFAGGGIRRAVATFPRLCKPCLGITARKVHGIEHTPHGRKEVKTHTTAQTKKKNKAKQRQVLGGHSSLCQLLPQTKEKDSWDLHILPWQEAAGGAQAKVEPGPGSSAHSDHPYTMTWSWLCSKNPQKGLVSGSNSYTNLFHYVPQSQTQETKRGKAMQTLCHPTCLPKLIRDTSAWPGLAILQGKEANVRGAFDWALPEDLTAPTDLPLYLSNRLRVEYLLFPSLPWVICPKRSDIAMKCHLVRKFFSAPLRFAFEMEKRRSVINLTIQRNKSFRNRGHG